MPKARTDLIMTPNRKFRLGFGEENKRYAVVKEDDFVIWLIY
jgi:hypothetical protein